MYWELTKYLLLFYVSKILFLKKWKRYFIEFINKLKVLIIKYIINPDLSDIFIISLNLKNILFNFSKLFILPWFNKIQVIVHHEFILSTLKI